MFDSLSADQLSQEEPPHLFDQELREEKDRADATIELNQPEDTNQ